MALIDLIKRISQKKSERSQKFKELEEDYHLQKMLEERQKSSNQRELERYMKENHENNIKRQLDIIRKVKTQEAWKDSSILKGGNKILDTNNDMLKNDTPMLQQKNIFMEHKTKPLMTNKSMFFKW